MISDRYEETREVSLEVFRPEFSKQAGELVIAIQRDEFHVPIRLEDQPDLLDIQRYYQRGLGQFWCALHEDEVVGTIGLLDLGHRAAALRKMFVKKEFRGGPGASIAQRLLSNAEAWCLEKRIDEIILGTIDSYAAARRFYERNSFQQIQVQELPSYFPKMKIDNTFYRKVLSKRQ